MDNIQENYLSSSDDESDSSFVESELRTDTEFYLKFQTSTLEAEDDWPPELQPQETNSDQVDAVNKSENQVPSTYDNLTGDVQPQTSDRPNNMQSTVTTGLCSNKPYYALFGNSLVTITPMAPFPIPPQLRRNSATEQLDTKPTVVYYEGDERDVTDLPKDPRKMKHSDRNIELIVLSYKKTEERKKNAGAGPGANRHDWLSNNIDLPSRNRRHAPDSQNELELFDEPAYFGSPTFSPTPSDDSGRDTQDPALEFATANHSNEGNGLLNGQATNGTKTNFSDLLTRINKLSSDKLNNNAREADSHNVNASPNITVISDDEERQESNTSKETIMLDILPSNGDDVEFILDDDFVGFGTPKSALDQLADIQSIVEGCLPNHTEHGSFNANTQQSLRIQEGANNEATNRMIKQEVIELDDDDYDLCTLVRSFTDNAFVDLCDSD